LEISTDPSGVDLRKSHEVFMQHGAHVAADILVAIGMGSFITACGSDGSESQATMGASRATRRQPPRSRAVPTPAPAPAPVPPPPAAVTAPASAAGGTLIPLYTAPSDPSWAAVVAAKAAHPTVSVLAVVNPANGPGDAVQASYTSGTAALASAGVKVLGYVYTGYGNRAAGDVQAAIDRWHAFYPAVTGIFFDEQSSALGREGYYRDLSAYAKARGLDFTVGNPGSDTAPTYVGTTDLILVYENAGLPSVSDLGGWHTTYDRRNFGIIPYGVAALDAAFVKAARERVGYIYLQSDALPNPWDSVPGYLDSLLGALE
jgi:hypothetical protein